jgi:hypothetical protein
MPGTVLQAGEKVILEREHFDRIFEVLRQLGYAVLGTTCRDGSIMGSRGMILIDELRRY